MLNVHARPFESGDARLYVDLAANAFSIVPRYARPKDSVDFVANTHGSENPSGRAIVAIADIEKRPVGHFSSIPFRFRRADGSPAIGWQLSCLAVDASMHRQGIGQKLVSAVLEETARAHPGDFTYVFPNPRSFGVLVRLGGLRLADVPTRIVLPALRRSRGLRDDHGERWEITTLDAAGARARVGAIAPREPQRGAFVRDASFFRWRFLGPDADRRYSFVSVARAGGRDEIVLALGEHRANGVRFTILVDAYPDVLDGRLGLAVRATQRLHGRPVYLTTNARWRGGPLAITVPERFGPRPVFTMIMPRGERFHAELARAPILTGDWMSF